MIKIDIEKFNELRKLSVAINDAIKSGDQRAQGLAGDMVNSLIDIEDKYLNGGESK